MDEVKDWQWKERKSKQLMLFFSLLLALSIIVQAYLMVRIIDQIFIVQAAFGDIVLELILLILAFIIRVIIDHLLFRVGNKTAKKNKIAARSALIKKYKQTPIHIQGKTQIGEKTNTFLHAVDEINDYFSMYLPQTRKSTTIPLVLWMVILIIHFQSALILLLTAPFIPLFMILIGLQTKKKSEEQLDELAKYSSKFLDVLQGITSLKIYNQSNKTKISLHNSSESFKQATMSILKIAFMNSFMLEVIAMLGIGIVALELAIQLIFYQSVSFFSAFFILVLVPEFFASLRELGSAFHQGKSSQGAIAKIEDALNNSEETEDKWENMYDLPDHQVRLASFDLHYSFQTSNFSLKDLNFDFKNYRKVAIIGKSGAGKTTLLNLLAGLITPTSGSVLVNDKKLTAYKESQWFEKIAYITQNPTILNETLRENLTFGNETVTEQDLIQVIEQVGLKELIDSFPNGLETKVGEGGRGLSGGEMQRVAIARAFLKQPAIVFLDEPTTGLDVKTEKILQNSIKEFEKNTTIIMVAHRLHTIQDADHILLLDDGELIAKGDHPSLLSSSIEYKEMIQAGKEG
ncbi:thiol reductant ABC exporter subunit CydD [Saliterribacillus persicus]|uniref:ATP-binding cassette subfamily C protein CydD n=1 Tax=Saliterribacillus persicus TaxID=930114 RepID=A0A368XVR7_9BACI|nr:thiol reductant ABC exporter subunit CydD [Saliterribacillus persicus]RCW71985.1 ATP-binding cassette subfamily C protein CydD [Saliterribacillus persicus]